MPALMRARAARRTIPDLRQGFQDRPDVHEDADRAGVEGATARRATAGISTNILGNRDGEVLDDPGSFKSKEETKMSVLDHILQPNLYPDLYKELCHVVRINYYPPRGDTKEGWDNIDIFGWLGYPMQIKINFLCRDSILAAPLVLDLVLFWTWRSARACAAFRNGCRSTSRRRCTRPGCIRSTTSSFS